MPISDTRIRNAKPAEKAYKLTDGAGLYLDIKPSGSKLWRLRYRISGKENVYAIGRYPQIGLADARKERDAAKNLIKKGIHPAHHRKLERIHRSHENANTFEAVATEWLDRKAEHWTERTYRQRKNALARHVFPRIGALPVRQVRPAHVLDITKRVEKHAPTMAMIVNQTIGGICRYATATLRADMDPTTPLRGALKPLQTQHHKPLKSSEISDFLGALEDYPAYFPNKVALRLMLLTLVRTVEVLGARWEEFDFKRNQWTIPAERMKRKEDHTVPLPSQAKALLEALRPVAGNREHLFPNRDNPRKPVSRGVLWKMVANMGYQGRFSPHGIRATGSTILNEMGYRPDVIETQLAHKERNKTRASYNRAEYLEERRVMMQAWADHLDSLSMGAEVIPIRNTG